MSYTQADHQRVIVETRRAYRCDHCGIIADAVAGSDRDIPPADWISLRTGEQQRTGTTGDDFCGIDCAAAWTAVEKSKAAVAAASVGETIHLGCQKCRQTWPEDQVDEYLEHLATGHPERTSSRPSEGLAPGRLSCGQTEGLAPG